MFFAFAVNGVNIIVPGFVRGGRLCARINRAAILAAVGVPAGACALWGCR